MNYAMVSLVNGGPGCFCYDYAATKRPKGNRFRARTPAGTRDQGNRAAVRWVAVCKAMSAGLMSFYLCW